MLDIKLRMEDLEDIEEVYSDFEMELGFTVDTLEEAIEYMEDELSGKYKDKFIEIFQEQIKQLNEYRENAAELYKFVSSVIEDINNTVDIENEQICFEYDEELLKKLVDNTEELLDSSSYDYKRIVEMSYGFEEWYNSQQNKLSIHIDSNKTLISQTASSIEEGLRLHDDKKVLTHNYNVIKNLDNKLQDINFDKEIEEIDMIKSYYLENENDLKELYIKVSKTKDIDLAHMMLAISVQLDNKPKGLILELGINGNRDEYYAWKGDVESGRMDTDDIKADINAYVIANIYVKSGHFNYQDATCYINAVNEGTLNPTDEFLKIYGNGHIEKGYDNVINQLNDTTSGTVVINEGMKKGAISELYDVLPLESLKFENYFSDNDAVKNSYNKFTDYLKTTSSMNNLSSSKELYD